MTLSLNLRPLGRNPVDPFRAAFAAVQAAVNGKITADVNGMVPAANLGNGAYIRPTVLIGADLNTLLDQPITVHLPAGSTLYRAQIALIFDPSAPVTTAVGGLWSGPGKTGTTLLGSGATGVALSGLTAAGANANGALVTFTPNNANTAPYDYPTLYFACSTIEGSPRTANVCIVVLPLN